MCHLFSHQPQRNYESQTRSLRIGGHCTSIRLEMSFWDTLEEIAAKEGMSVAKFLTTLHNEVLDHHGEVNNFASLLRCCWRSRSSATRPSMHFRCSVLQLPPRFGLVILTWRFPSAWRRLDSSPAYILASGVWHNWGQAHSPTGLVASP